MSSLSRVHFGQKGRTDLQSGFASTWVLGIAALLLSIGLVFFEIGHVFVERGKLVAAADAASSAGATAIDEDELLESGKVILNDDSIQRCNDSLFKSKSPGGQASTILDANQNGNNSFCELSDDAGTVTAVAKGTIKFGPVFSFLGIEKREMVVRSNARPSCSDDDSVEGGC